MEATGTFTADQLRSKLARCDVYIGGVFCRAASRAGSSWVFHLENGDTRIVGLNEPIQATIVS